MKFSNIWLIAKRDFKSSFTTPVAYVVLAFFLGMMGATFYSSVVGFNAAVMQYQQFNQGHALSLTEGVINPLYGMMTTIFLFLAPALTMRLFAEERKNLTFPLLMTSPVKLWEIVLGKWLSAVLILLVIFSITSVYPIVLFLAGNPDGGALLTTILGTFLIASSFLAFGTLFSAMTENQFIAFICAFFGNLLLWMINWFAGQGTGPVTEFFQSLSIISHYMNFMRGMIHSGDLVYYVSFIFVSLFLTHRVLDSYRWR